MKMIGVVLAGVAGLLMAVSSGAQEKTGSVFQMTDGYLQFEGRQPIHLTHVDHGRQKVWVGDKLVKGAISPCTRRDDEPCILRVSLVGRSHRKEIISKNESTTRIDSEISYALGGYPISRQLDSGPAVLRFSVVKDDKVIFEYDIPIEVQ